MIITTDNRNRIGIIGAGGLGKEVLCTIADVIGWTLTRSNVTFLVEEQYYTQQSVLGIQVLPLTNDHLHFDLYILAIGDIDARIRISNHLSPETRYGTIIHPSAQITPFTKIGDGSIILAQTFLSCDVQIGRFSLLNPGTTISHDSTAGDYFTTSPGVNISGNCQLGDRVFMGTNACTRNALHICDDAIIGMGAVVVKDIEKPGTYIGNPAVLI